MKKRYLPFQTYFKKEYENVQHLFNAEGGGFYFGTKNNNFYVLSDFGTLSDFFYEDELKHLVSEYEFNNKNECINFLKQLFEKTGNEENNFRIPEALL